MASEVALLNPKEEATLAKKMIAIVQEAVDNRAENILSTMFESDDYHYHFGAHMELKIVVSKMKVAYDKAINL